VLSYEPRLPDSRPDPRSEGAEGCRTGCVDGGLSGTCRLTRATTALGTPRSLSGSGDRWAWSGRRFASSPPRPTARHRRTRSSGAATSRRSKCSRPSWRTQPAGRSSATSRTTRGRARHLHRRGARLSAPKSCGGAQQPLEVRGNKIKARNRSCVNADDPAASHRAVGRRRETQFDELRSHAMAQLAAAEEDGPIILELRLPKTTYSCVHGGTGGVSPLVRPFRSSTLGVGAAMPRQPDRQARRPRA
jgi:hypothetical protein